MIKTNCFSWLALLVCALFAITALPSCGDEEEEVSTLSLSMSSINMDADGGQQEIAVTSNTLWSVEGASNWCSVSPATGNGNGSFTIKVAPNSNPDQNICTLTVQTADGAISKNVTVAQSGLAVTLSINPSELKFNSDKSDKKTLQITCNGEWSISDLPDWIDVDPIGGKGDRIVTFTTKSENATAEDRVARITITAGLTNQSVKLTQEAGLSDCYVEPEGIVTIYNGVAFLSTKHGNVKNYRAGYLKASSFNKYTQKELLEVTRKFDAITVFDRVESIHMLEPDTEYYLLTLAYDTNDQEGELHKAAFKTKPSGDAQAFVTIDNLTYYNNDIYWETHPDGSTDKYYTMFLSGLSNEEMVNLLYVYDDNLYVDNVKLAWYLNNEIDRGTDCYKIKKGEAEIQETCGFNIENDHLVKRGNAFQLGYSVFVAWGINVSDDKFSGYVSVKYSYVEYNSSTKKNEIKQINSINGKKIKDFKK